MWQKVLKQLKSYNVDRTLYWSIFKAANYGNLEKEKIYILQNEEPLGEQYASRFVGMT